MSHLAIVQMATSLAGLQVLLDSYALPCPRYWPASDPLLTASSLHLLLAHARRTRSQPRPPHGRRASSLLLLAGAPRRDALAGTAGAGGAEGDSLVVVGRCDDDFWFGFRNFSKSFYSDFFDRRAKRETRQRTSVRLREVKK